MKTTPLNEWDKVEETKYDNEGCQREVPQDEIISKLVNTVNKLVDEVLALKGDKR